MKWKAKCETGMWVVVEADTKEEALEKLKDFNPDPSTIKES